MLTGFVGGFFFASTGSEEREHRRRAVATQNEIVRPRMAYHNARMTYLNQQQSVASRQQLKPAPADVKNFKFAEKRGLRLDLLAIPNHDDLHVPRIEIFPGGLQ